jgi:hypothetical protein
MSRWYEPNKEDIDFADDEKEMHVYLDSDESGAIYVSLKVDDVAEKMSSIMARRMVEKRNKGMTKESMKSMMTKASHSTKKYKAKHSLSTPIGK